MAYDVEDKVVQMRFDNRDFDPNIDASIKSLEKLEKSLRMANGTKGFEEVDKQAKNFNLNPALAAVETLEKGFSALKIAGITAISEITHHAMAFGQKIVDAFAVAPLRSGWSEYSEQMNSTQVIMSNTGDTLSKITTNLDELNEYADRTIYSFGQMTTAIGKFAAAGVELTDATKAIKGLSSAAATVGASNQQLFSAYYNLAQSLQLGYVQLIDWKSLENSTIGNKTMREAFIKTAIEMDKFTESSEQAQKAYADFRGSLSSKWLTSDVVLATLQKYSKAIKVDEAGIYHVFNEETRQMGETLEKHVDAITGAAYYTSEAFGRMEEWEVKLAETAYKSATEIKSFQQMWDTLTEAAGTGWAETWKIIFGDLEQAKELWTSVSNSIESVITAFTNLRNEALKMWGAWGGREDLAETIKSLARIFSNIGRTIAEAIAILTGSVSELDDKATNAADKAGRALASITRRLRIFVEAIEKGTENVQQHAEALAKILRPLRWVGKALSFVAKVALSIILIGDALVKTIINILINIQDLPELIKEIFGNTGLQALAGILKGIISILQLFFGIIVNVYDTIHDAVYNIKLFVNTNVDLKNSLTGIGEVFKNVLTFIFDFIDAIGKSLIELHNFRKEGKNFEGVFKVLSKIAGSDFVSGLSEGLKNGTSEITSGIKTMGQSMIDTLREVLDEHSPSKVAIAIGSFFAVGLVIGLLESLKYVPDAATLVGETVAENTTEGLEEGTDKELSPFMASLKKGFENAKVTLASLANDVSQFYQETLKPMILNLNAGKVLAIGFSVAIISLLFVVGYLLTKIATSIGQVSDAIVNNLNAMAAETRAKAFDHIAEGIFTIAKAIALLTLIGKWNPEGLKRAAIMLGIFAAAISAIVLAFSILYNKIEQLKSIGDGKKALERFLEIQKAMTKMVSISIMLFSITIAITSMSKSIAILSELDTASMFKGLAVIEIMIVTLVGVIFVLSKFTAKLTSGTLILFAFSYAVKLFTNALSSISGGLEDGINRLTNMSEETIIKLILLIGSLSVLSAYVGKASTAIVKSTMALTMLSLVIGVMAYVLGKVNDETGLVSEFLKYFSSGGAALTLIGVMASVTLMIIVMSKYAKEIHRVGATLKEVIGPLSRLALTFGLFIGAISILFATISVARYYMTEDEWNKSLSAFGLIMVSMALGIGLILAGLYVLSKEMTSAKGKLNPSLFETFNKVLKSVSALLVSVTFSFIVILGAMSLFWNYYRYDTEIGLTILASSLIGIVVLCGAIAGLIAVAGHSIKGDGGKGILKVLIPIIFMIGELIAAVALFSAMAQDSGAFSLAISGITIIMLSMSLLIMQIAKLEQDSKSTLASGSSSEKNFNSMLKMITTIIVGIGVFLGEIGALSIILGNTSYYSAFGLSIAAFGIVILGIIAAIRVITDQASKMDAHYEYESLGRIRDILVILGGLYLTVASTTMLMGNSSYSWGEAIAVMTAMGLVVGAAVVAVVKMIQILKGITITADKIQNIGILFGFLGASMLIIAGAVNSLRGINAGTAIGEMFVLTNMAVGISAMVILLVKALSGVELNPQTTANIAVVMGSVALLVLTLGASMAMVAKAAENTDPKSLAAFDGLVSSVLGIIVALILLTKLIDKANVENFQAGGLTASFTGGTKGLGELIQLGTIFKTIAKGLLIMAGAMAIIASIPTDKLPSAIVTMGLLIAAVTAMSAGLMIISKYVGNSNGIGIMLIQIASGFAILSAAMLTLSFIPIDKVNSVIETMWAMTGAMAALSALALIISKLNQYAIIGAAVIAAIGASMIMGATGISILAKSPLDELAAKLKFFSDEKVINGMWAFVGAFSALAIGLTLGGPGLLIVAAALLALSLAFASMTSTLSVLTTLTDKIDGLFVALSGISKVIKPIFQLIGILVLAAPILIVFSLLATLLIGVISLGISAMASLANSLDTVAATLVPFTNALKEAGEIIFKNQAAFYSLALFVMGIGLAAFIAAPGLIAVAVALVIVASGIALILVSAAPLAAVIGGIFVAITAVIGAMKDAFKELITLLIDKLPQVVNIVNTMSGSVNIMTTFGDGLSALGWGLLVFGLGGIVAAVGIAALCGAFILLKMTIDKIFGDQLTTKFDAFVKRIDDIASVNGVIAGLGGALLLLGVGSLLAGVGILLLSGALKVFSIVIQSIVGTTSTFTDAMSKLIAPETSGGIALLGAGLLALGVGLAAFGVGSLAAGIGMLVLTLGLIALTAPLLLIIDAIISFVNSITALVASVTGCINAMSLFTIVLTGLVANANLIQVGIGLMLIAAGFLALAGVSVLIMPLIPILLLVTGAMTLVNSILYMTGDAIEVFTGRLETASQHISNSIMNIVNTFNNAIDVILTGISKLSNLSLGGNSKSNGVPLFGGSKMVKFGADTAKNLLLGYIKGMTKSLPIFRKVSGEASDEIQTGVTDPLGIASPSEWFAWAARMCSSGFDKGMAGEMPSFFGSGEAAGTSVMGGFVDGLKDKAANSKVGKIVTGVIDVATGKAEVGDVVKKYVGEDSPLGNLTNILGSIWNGDGLNLFGDGLNLFGDQAEGADAYSDSLGDLGNTAGSTKSKLESLTDTIRNQMKIFDRFTFDEEMIDPQELIHNMESQLRGMRNWASGIDMLTARGISAPLLQYLAEMGPEGYKYVEAFLEMTEEEFQQANALYSESLDVPSEVASHITDDYRQLGIDISEAVADGYTGGGGSGNGGIQDPIVDETEETVEKVYDIANSGAKATLAMLAELYSQGGINAKYAFVRELEKWMTMDEYQNFINDAVRNRDYDKLKMNVDFVGGNQLRAALTDAGVEASDIIGEASEAEFKRNEENFRNSMGDFYVNGTKMTGTQYADLCVDNEKQLMAVVIEDGVEPEKNAKKVVERTVDEVNAELKANQKSVSNTAGEVGDAAGSIGGENTTKSFEQMIENWLETDLPGLGVTWREKIAEELSVDPSSINAMDEYTLDTFVSANKGEKIKTKKWGKDRAVSNNYRGKQSLTDLGRSMTNAINAMTDEEAENIIIHTVDGLYLNAKDYLEACKDVGTLIGGTIYGATAKELGIASPSKKYAEIAQFSVLGFVKGINDSMHLAENASENLGDSTLASLSDTIQAISAQFTDDLDTTPTIRPVLDLDNVYSGMTELDTMFSTAQARVAGKAYVTTHDDSVERLEDAYKKAIMDGNLELANMLLNSEDTNVIVNVILDTNAEGIFDIVKVENEKETRRSGASPLMIARKNAINAGVIA